MPDEKQIEGKAVTICCSNGTLCWTQERLWRLMGPIYVHVEAAVSELLPVGYCLPQKFGDGLGLPAGKQAGEMEYAEDLEVRTQAEVKRQKEE